MERVGEEKKVTKLWKLEDMSIQMKANCIADPGEPNPNPALQNAETQPNLNPKILTRVRTGLDCPASATSGTGEGAWVKAV